MEKSLQEPSDILEEVKQWVNDNDNKLEALKKAIEYEEENEEEGCPFSDKDEHGKICWNPTRDASISPSYVSHLKTAPFIGIVYDSNKHTDLSIKNLEKVKEAVNEIEDEPDDFSDEWVDQSIQAVNKSIDDVLDRVDLTQEEIQDIKRKTEENEALEFWKDYIAPSLKHRDKAKKAILIMLASPEDTDRHKGRINVKIYGPPGTGKSSIKKYLRREFGALSIDGARVSKADLTFNKSNSEFGKLPKAHKGIIVVEEADEMGSDELGATLTSLGETGKIEIRDMEIPAEARGIMLSNFESKREIIRKWSPESLNRFDFVIKFDLLDDEDKNEALEWHYKYFRKPKPESDEFDIKKYIKLVRTFYPELEEIDEIKEYKDDNIREIQNVREGLSIMNVAWTIARLNLEDVKLCHYKKAFNLVSSEERVLSDKFSSG